MAIEQGDFVEVRGRQWLVEAINDAQPDLTTVKLSCIADDAQGEQIEVLWDAEIGATVLEEDTWSRVGRGAPDSPEVLAAYVKTIRWRSATAADRDLLQAPFRAGIRLDAYQLLPLRKALRLPRVNLLIADDVGLGKTVEAGLVARELLLRRRIDYIVISAPAAMAVQWKDELESKFGLTFDIVDRERIHELRRLRGFSVNPWTTGSRFILSHSLLAEEDYVAGLRDADSLTALSRALAQIEPDARVHWLVRWIKENMLSGGTWNNRRLIIFTEWEDTRRWVEKRLREALAETDQIDHRIDVFTGITGQDRREEVKAAFNADPVKEPLRILICTDAAREGINLQTYCADLIHLDLPWNPSRLEQRNGRIDRKLQPAKQVFCRYFRYEQREADIVLEALVRKTEVIQRQLGSAGQVIEKRITDRLAQGGIDRGAAAALAKAIEDETDAERLARARAEMDDEERARYARVVKEQEELKAALEESRERVGVKPEDLQRAEGSGVANSLGLFVVESDAGTRQGGADQMAQACADQGHCV